MSASSSKTPVYLVRLQGSDRYNVINRFTGKPVLSGFEAYPDAMDYARLLNAGYALHELDGVKEMQA